MRFICREDGFLQRNYLNTNESQAYNSFIMLWSFLTSEEMYNRERGGHTKHTIKVGHEKKVQYALKAQQVTCGDRQQSLASHILLALLALAAVMISKTVEISSLSLRMEIVTADLLPLCCGRWWFHKLEAGWSTRQISIKLHRLV